MKIGTEHIGEQRIEIEVDGHGQFFAEFNDHTFTHDTRKGLIEQLTKAVKKAAQQGTVEVTVLGLVPNPEHGKRGYSSEPFKLGAGVVHAKLRSVHERNYHTYLLISDAGQKFQVSGSREGTISRRLSDEEVRGYLALVEAQRIAATALENFVGAVKISPEDALRAAVKKGAA